MNSINFKIIVKDDKGLPLPNIDVIATCSNLFTTKSDGSQTELILNELTKPDGSCSFATQGGGVASTTLNFIVLLKDPCDRLSEPKSILVGVENENWTNPPFILIVDKWIVPTKVLPEGLI
jgi:hypothetical protein